MLHGMGDTNESMDQKENVSNFEYKTNMDEDGFPHGVAKNDQMSQLIL